LKSRRSPFSQVSKHPNKQATMAAISLDMRIDVMKMELERLVAERATLQALDAPAPAAAPAPAPAAAGKKEWHPWARKMNIPTGQKFRIYLTPKSDNFLEVIGERDGEKYIFIETKEDGTTKRHTAPSSVAGHLKRRMGAPLEVKGGKLTDCANAAPRDVYMLHPSGKYVGMYEKEWNGYCWNEENSSYTKVE